MNILKAGEEINIFLIKDNPKPGSNTPSILLGLVMYHPACLQCFNLLYFQNHY